MKIFYFQKGVIFSVFFFFEKFHQYLGLPTLILRFQLNLFSPGIVWLILDSTIKFLHSVLLLFYHKCEKGGTQWLKISPDNIQLLSRRSIESIAPLLENYHRYACASCPIMMVLYFSSVLEYSADRTETPFYLKLKVILWFDNHVS